MDGDTLDFDGRLSVFETKLDEAVKRLDAHGGQIDELRLHRERVDVTLAQINATTTKTAADVLAIRDRLDRVEDAPDEQDADKWRKAAWLCVTAALSAFIGYALAQAGLA